MFGGDIDSGGGGIEAIFEKFFYYGGGSLDDFSSGDAVNCFRGEGADGRHGCCLLLSSHSLFLPLVFLKN